LFLLISERASWWAATAGRFSDACRKSLGKIGTCPILRMEGGSALSRSSSRRFLKKTTGEAEQGTGRRVYGAQRAHSCPPARARCCPAPALPARGFFCRVKERRDLGLDGKTLASETRSRGSWIVRRRRGLGDADDSDNAKLPVDDSYKFPSSTRAAGID
jgi:hypothetical protein